MKATWPISLSVVITALLSSNGLDAAPPADSFEMRELARLPFIPRRQVTCGDADRDGRAELYATLFGPGDDFNYALEYAGGGHFDSVRLGWANATSWDMGDADRDGKVDIVLQDPGDGQYLRVAESPDSSSLPDSVVWSMPFQQGDALRARITDLDLDKRPELAVRVRRDLDIYYVSLYEFVADDSFALVTSVDPPNVPLGLTQTDDLDGDGKPELVVGTSAWFIMFYECAGDDSLEEAGYVLLDNHESIDAVAAAPDLDRDGRPEAIAFGQEQGGLGTLVVIESPSDDSFEIVWMRRFPAIRIGASEVVVGDLDGDSVPEFAVTDGDSVRLFRCTGNDSYEQFWQAHTHEFEVGLYDITGNGRCELIYCVQDGDVITRILEYVPLGIAEQEQRRLEQICLSPSVVRPGAPVRLSGLRPGLSAQLLDVSGRSVLTTAESTIRTAGLSPGAYFCRISSGNQSAVRKLLVVP